MKTLAPTTKTVSFRGKEEELQLAVIADKTAAFHLQLWGNQIQAVREGECYEITNLSTRNYNGPLTLTTTPSTVFTPIANFSTPDTIHEPPMEKPTVIIGTIKATNLTLKYRCDVCKHNQDTELLKDARFHRCTFCHRNQLAHAYKHLLAGHISFLERDQTRIKEYRFTHSAAMNMMKINNLLHYQNNPTELEEYMLIAPIVELTVDHEHNIGKMHIPNKLNSPTSNTVGKCTNSPGQSVPSNPVSEFEIPE